MQNIDDITRVSIGIVWTIIGTVSGVYCRKI